LTNYFFKSQIPRGLPGGGMIAVGFDSYIIARQHTILDIHLRPVSFAELCIVDVNRDLFKIWMSVGKPGATGGDTSGKRECQ
jgi:hypothetical protein